jgi:hypothetical protein
MSRIVSFNGYSIGSSPVFIVANRITDFSRIEYNGRAGVEITLDCGKVVRVDAYIHDVKIAIDKALECAA